MVGVAKGQIDKLDVGRLHQLWAATISSSTVSPLGRPATNTSDGNRIDDGDASQTAPRALPRPCQRKCLLLGDWPMGDKAAFTAVPPCVGDMVVC